MLKSLKALAQDYIDHKINTHDFVDEYMDAWKSNNALLDGLHELSASCIFFNCDLFNDDPETRKPYEIDEKELIARVQMSLDGKSDEVLERAKTQQTIVLTNIERKALRKDLRDAVLDKITIVAQPTTVIFPAIQTWYINLNL